MSAAVDASVTARVEVDKVDEQLTTLDTDEATPVPEHFVATVSGTHRHVAVVNALTTLTHMHAYTHTHIHSRHQHLSTDIDDVNVRTGRFRQGLKNLGFGGFFFSFVGFLGVSVKEDGTQILRPRKNMLYTILHVKLFFVE